MAGPLLATLRPYATARYLVRVKLTAELSGTRDGAAWPARGETVDLPDTEGAELCAAGLAEPVAEPDADVEITTERKPEVRRGRPRKTDPA